MAQELKAEWGRSLPGDLLKRWPRDADGEPVPPAMLTKCTGVDMTTCCWSICWSLWHPLPEELSGGRSVWQDHVRYVRLRSGNSGS